MRDENNFPLTKSPETSMGIFASGNGTRNPVLPVFNEVFSLLLKKKRDSLQWLHDKFIPFSPSRFSQLVYSLWSKVGREGHRGQNCF